MASSIQKAYDYDPRFDTDLRAGGSKYVVDSVLMFGDGPNLWAARSAQVQVLHSELLPRTQSTHATLTMTQFLRVLDQGEAEPS